MPPPTFSSARRMTANPLKPAKRYRPGKAIVEEKDSSEDDEEEADESLEEQRKDLDRPEKQQLKPAPPPKASSFPAKDAKQITSGVRDVKLQEEEDEEGFVTEEEDEGIAAPSITRPGNAQPRATSESAESSGSEEEESEDEESSSEDDAPTRKLLRPTFIKKNQRKESATPGSGIAATSIVEEDEAELRKEKADAMIRNQLEKEAAARAAQKKSWDDDDETGAGVEEVNIDDTDGLDAAAELAAWRLRELKRVKREREAIETAEKEREEIERRRNLTAEERDHEDREFIARQKEEREASRGKAGFMQKYFHKGAFFQPDSEKHGLAERDLMGSRYVDEVQNREALPQYLQVRDMTRVGRKGKTKYKDLKTEDTGRWGVESYYGSSAPANSSSRFGITDERFAPDRVQPSGPTGANASSVRERDRPPRRRSRSRSPVRQRYRSRSRSTSKTRTRRRSRSKSRSPRRGRYRDEYRTGRKRSPPPYSDRDKRRRVDTTA
ncbi:hypothetical protein LOZ12_003378 [Ophidiomyces ophidiicola]|uniref:Uncharacterized protein n=1 Tax=Ophidiomyces ophidiicola TaxID=1387563 RepID=A0ACB8UZ12_9EURO|nr:uncharacterized protein LOZ57_004493 [Ophidiomyces ophidiicola]KAI1907357.1 hypothetical protein LOZ64_005919 [Ophidiomyces ophidiicola]KAI1945194.1 hypothetical protein LOZ57_004493 [Ophidiomyces ophidiicola]KAI1946598.1 hypothetical protein LOZ62_003315 [Ophidiomyces ophidiicola]KAI1972871.1 hypothetical protein LOZ56_002218 [Ophidiomyces ophidiicola]KAI2001546.1 hypothetical protein LOZ50_005603 [Ophidiomyces ophidiicola]